MNDMSNKLMVLPCKDFIGFRLIKIPDDYEEQEAFRKVTGIIARIEESKADFTWDDIICELEDVGFEQMDFVLGPLLEYKE